MQPLCQHDLSACIDAVRLENTLGQVQAYGCDGHHKRSWFCFGNPSTSLRTGGLGGRGVHIINLSIKLRFEVGIRGSDRRSGERFSYVGLERRVPAGHPLRAVRELTNTALADLSSDFAALYSGMGRPSIAPEMLLRAMLLQAFCSIRSERQLMERLDFDLLFRWVVGLGVDDSVWDHSTFSKNRDRLLAGDVAARFLAVLLASSRVKRLLSSDHFSVDGTLIDAWARRAATT